MHTLERLESAQIMLQIMLVYVCLLVYLYACADFSITKIYQILLQEQQRQQQNLNSIFNLVIDFLVLTRYGPTRSKFN